jgi:hypothetical protein
MVMLSAGPGAAPAPSSFVSFILSLPSFARKLRIRDRLGGARATGVAGSKCEERSGDVDSAGKLSPRCPGDAIHVKKLTELLEKVHQLGDLLRLEAEGNLSVGVASHVL